MKACERALNKRHPYKLTNAALFTTLKGLAVPVLLDAMAIDIMSRNRMPSLTKLGLNENKGHL